MNVGFSYHRELISFMKLFSGRQTSRKSVQWLSRLPKSFPSFSLGHPPDKQQQQQIPKVDDKCTYGKPG